MGFRVFPASDLHLLQGMPINFSFWATFPTWQDLTALPGFAITPTMAGGIVSWTGGTGLTTSVIHTGDTMVRWTLSSNTLAPTDVFVRITVYQAIRQLWCATSSIALETGRTDRVLTVYAQFEPSPGVFVTRDVTSHPYLRYALATHAGSPTLAIDPATGRIDSGTTAGEVDVTVSIDPALAQTATTVIRLKVVPEVTDRPILDLIHTGIAFTKRSILLLPDGYLESQKAVFDDDAKKVTDRLFDAANRISPYSLLRESFDVYRAFVPSAEEGVSIGPPIVPRPGPDAAEVGYSLPPDQPIAAGAATLAELIRNLGHPWQSAITTVAAARTALGANATQLPNDLFDLWRSLTTRPQVARDRDTFFGIMIGDRHHGTDAPRPVMGVTAPLTPEAAFLFDRATPVRGPVIDERRLPSFQNVAINPSDAHVAGLSRFLRTLRVPGGAMHFGERWSRNEDPVLHTMIDGDDFGLVVILARAEHYSGVSITGCVVMSLGGGIVHHTDPSLLVPGTLDVLPVQRPVSTADAARGFIDRPLDSRADVLAHELTHTVAMGSLNDEYGASGGRQANPGNASTVEFVEAGPNTQMLASVVSGTGISPPKWNWPRARSAARIQTRAVNGANLEIGINSDDASRWTSTLVGQPLILLPGKLATTPPTPGTATLVSFSVATQTLVCTPTGGPSANDLMMSFPEGSLVIAPRSSSSLLPFAPARLLIAPLVAADLLANGVFSPSTSPGCVITAPVLRAIAGFHPPAHQLQVLGAYESGASFDCGVIHPTGECKMITVIANTEPPVDFCFVCKYAMVGTSDPALLPLLDGEYP